MRTWLSILSFTLAGLAYAQTPTGTVVGVVRDPSGSLVAGARVKAVSFTTGLARSAATPEQGGFSFPALLAGEYELSVEAPGFQRTVRVASVEAGQTTTADLNLSVGEVTESVTVDGASPQMRYDTHTLGGVVTQSQIENLPLNGRSFLELAKLEPGVQPATSATSHRAFVPVLGSPGGGNSGRGTRVTIDGGSIMAVGNTGSGMGLSQETVQEFQIETQTFDLSTGRTFSGAINVVTRAGANQLHGSAFYFFRDHTLAAYPALQRDPVNPNPFFQRRQFGGSAGGAILHDRLFFFANWERNEQRGVASRTYVGDFASLSGITPSPTFGDLATLRLDARLSNVHSAFLRYSHDGSRAFSGSANQYPSAWSRQLAWADQSMLGVTSVLRPTLVNEFRYSYFFFSSKQYAPEEQDCHGCLGIGQTQVNIGGLILGNSSSIFNFGRRFQLTDTVSWQKGAHRLRLGVDWEHNRGGVLAVNNVPATITLFSSDQVRVFDANPKTSADMRISLPAAFNTWNDFLSLPLQTVGLGIGDPRVPQANGNPAHIWNPLRLFVHDTWKIHPRLTLNYGLAWSTDHELNYDLSKPALLAPLLGANGLGPTRRNWKDFSPVLGLAWAASRDGKTVIRAGSGIFYDFPFTATDNERSLLGPSGLGLLPVSGPGILNPLAGIPGVAIGIPLNFINPTRFNGGDFVSILTSVRAEQTRQLASRLDPSVLAIQKNKAAPSLGSINPEHLPSWYAVDANAGVQREIARDFVISADFAFRRYIHGPLGGDSNHFNSVRGPVIPACTATAQQDDPNALCSRGQISIGDASARQTYSGLLVRADKRFSRRYQFLGSYAWSNNIATSGGPGLNLDNKLANVGPAAFDVTHIVNLAGVVQLPAHLETGLNFSYSSAPPLSATVGSTTNGIDFNGDGTFGDLLPGTTVNAFNRGMGRSDLMRLVNEYNQTYANKSDAHGRSIPFITLPARFGLGNAFQSLDLRLSRSFAFREHWRLSLIGEAFNLYNKANLSGQSGDLTRPGFGQPTQRATQIFGSNGPRAFQLALRVAF